MKYEDVKYVEINLLAWHFVQNDEEYDGVYEIKFNDNYQCVYFKA